MVKVIYMVAKVKKNLFFPDWIAKILDVQGESYGGPGVCVAAAIYAFSRLSRKDKIKALQEYRAKEIIAAYEVAAEEDENAAAEVLPSGQRKHPGRTGAKSG